MESFSILALNRPLRWLGSDTWEALSNSFALNIWHTCRKTWKSCCCRGLWSISFQFPIAFVFIFILVWVISPKLNGTRLFNLEPNMSNDLK